MRILTLLLTLFISTAALSCPKYQHMKAGDEALCSGTFFNSEMEKSIRKDVRDNQLRKKQITLKDLQLKLITKDRDKWLKSAHVQSKARYNQKNDLRNGAIGGAIVAFLSVYLAGSFR